MRLVCAGGLCLLQLPRNIDGEVVKTDTAAAVGLGSFIHTCASRADDQWPVRVKSREAVHGSHRIARGGGVCKTSKKPSKLTHVLEGARQGHVKAFRDMQKVAVRTASE